MNVAKCGVILETCYRCSRARQFSRGVLDEAPLASRRRVLLLVRCFCFYGVRMTCVKFSVLGCGGGDFGDAVTVYGAFVYRETSISLRTAPHNVTGDSIDEITFGASSSHPASCDCAGMLSSMYRGHVEGSGMHGL